MSNKREITFGRGWLGLLSGVLLVLSVAYIVLYPAQVQAAGQAKVNNSIVTFEGYVRLPSGQPVSNVTIDIDYEVIVQQVTNNKKAPVREFKHIVSLKTNSNGRYWGRFTVPVDTTYLSVFIDGKNQIAQIIPLSPKHATDFNLTVSKGFSLLGLQTFAY